MCKRISLFLLFCASIWMYVSGCSSQKAASGSPDTGIIMEYHQKQGMVSNYSMQGTGSSQMEVMGNTMATSESVTGEIVHKIAQVSSDNLTHELSFSKLNFSVSSDMVGDVSPDASSVINKVLKLTTGKRGENIQILNFEEVHQPDLFPPPILQAFDILPELAANPVKLNDSWHASQNLNMTAAGTYLNSTSETDYTFAGLEKKSDFECMKITAVSSARISGSGYSQGQEMQISGTVGATLTYYFDYKEGIVIEVSGESTSNLDMQIAGMADHIFISQRGSILISYIK